MKKRLLSALLALALVFVLLPTTALAGSIDPDITIAGTEYDFELENYKENTYKTVYYQHDKFLTKFEYTSDGVWATDPYLELTKTGAGNATTITITVHKGSNTTKAFEIKSAETCIATSSSYWNLVITGSGALSLTHTGTSAAIWSNHSNITITGGVTVNVKGTKSGSNINSYSNAIQCGETFTVSNGATVVAENNSTYSNGPAVKTEKFIISGDAKFEAQSAYGGKAISFDSITADGYDFMGRSGNSGSYTTLTGDDKATELQKYSSIKITPTPTPALEKSNVCVAGTNLYKNTAYTIQNGKPVMGGTYPGNYNIYFDATDYVLHVKNADIDATGKTGISGTSNIVFEGTNSITASTYGIYSDFKSSNLNISGSGFLTVETYAGNSAIATAYTSMSIIISGQGFTVTADTSRTNVSAIYSDKGGLTIKDGATVKAISANNSRAIRIGGSLTVTDATLTATSTSDRKPTIEVEGGASFTGSTVTITNNSDRQGKSGEYSYEVSTGLYVGGTLDIKNAAKVTSTVIGGNAIYAKGDITISGDSTEVNAQNSAYKFSAISTNRTVNISDNSTVKAENLKKHQGDPTGETDPSTGKTYNACPAITGKIANKNTQNKLHIEGFTTSSAGSQNPTEGTPLYLDIAPGSVESYIHHYKVTITRGDEVTHTESPVVIAGTTLLNDTYYTITDGSTVAVGTDESNYNAFYDSVKKTLKLNNAKISTTTNNAAIEITGDLAITVTGTNELKGNYNHCIESWSNFTINGPGTLEMTNTNSSSSATSVIHCGPGKSLTIAAEVIIKNEDHPGKLILTVTDNAYSFAEGYNVYASKNVSGSPLETYDAAKSSTYKYLCVTTQTLETGGGSTHEHVWDEAWHDTGDYHHAHQCTICKAYDTTTQESHNVTGHRDNHDGSHSNICGSCGYSAKVSHSYTWAPNANDNEKHIGTCVCGNVVEKNHNFVGDVCSDCGYDKSTGTTCEHVWTTEWTIDTVDNEYHWHKCIKCNAITDKKPHAYTIVTDSGTNHIRECECKVFYVEDHISSDWIIDTPATATTAGSMHKECTVCKHKMQTEVIPATGEIVPPPPDNPGTIVIIRPAEEEKPAQQPNPSTGANDLVGLAVAAAVAAALGSAALLRKHD